MVNGNWVGDGRESVLFAQPLLLYFHFRNLFKDLIKAGNSILYSHLQIKRDIPDAEKPQLKVSAPFHEGPFPDENL